MAPEATNASVPILMASSQLAAD
jgi:hypothetical protein